LEAYSDGAPAYDTRWAAYNRATVAQLRRPLTERAPGRLLDLGCGTANLAAALGGWGSHPELYLGVDLAPEMLAVARGKLRASPPGFPWALAAGDASALPVASGTLETVVSASSLHYWPDPAATLALVRAALRPGGRLVILDWARDTLPMRVLDRWLRWRGERYRRVYTLAEGVSLLEAAGFRVRRAGRHRGPAWWELLVVEAEAP